MSQYRYILLVSIFVLFIGACAQPAPPSPTPMISTAPGIVLSEVMAGADGNNNLEFIELYNASGEIIDLKGWTLWYRLATSQEDLLVYRWKSPSLIPPNGHIVLARSGEDIGESVNGTFEQSLNTSGGGLVLRNQDKDIIDSLGWGKAPVEFLEGEPAVALENGNSLERAPGGEAGNGIDTDSNNDDFFLNPSPAPQNTGSPVTPKTERGLILSLNAPEVVQPGNQFDYLLTVTNDSDKTLHDIQVDFPIPAGVKLISPQDGITITKDVTIWNLDSLDPASSQSITLLVDVPWTYFTALATNYYARADNWSGFAFGEPVYTQVEGGVIPIGTARELMNAELTVEGIATMYTGGYYAGGGNTKFYIEDDSGGLQVQVFDGEGIINITPGAVVRVKGTIGAYRGAMQIVPGILPDDVETITPANQSSPWSPTQVSIQQAAHDMETLPGRLVQVEGTLTRLEEFTYSYEIDLADENGQILTLYVDKLTEINVESLEEGGSYRATGILEVRDGGQMLYPRLQSDLTQVFPPVLILKGAAPSTVPPGDVFTTTITLHNYTPYTVTDIYITAPLPKENATLETVLDGGELSGDMVTWNIPELAGDGKGVSVRYQLRSNAELGDYSQIKTDSYTATAAEWTEPASGPALRTFIGDSVPIWAIQGKTFRSPHVLNHLTTQGVITGVFFDAHAPTSLETGLGGFWIEEIKPDDNPLTSQGLFIKFDDTFGDQPFELTLSPGDLVQISGQVRELSQQTTLLISEAEDINVLSKGNEIPIAKEIDPPEASEDALSYNEALEGMLVQATGPAWSVSPTSKYGEYVLVLPKHNVDRLWQGKDNGIAIMVDDGTNSVHADQSTLPYTIATRNKVFDLVGPLAYTFGRYKIEPVESPDITHEDLSYTPLEPISADEFSLMTWNVENLFDIRAPHPDDPPIPRQADYELDLNKIANTIQASGIPTIVGLQEVENIKILEDLANHQLLTHYRYQPVLVEGTDSRGIDVGYLVRGDRAHVLETIQYNAPEGLTSRPPLLIKVEVNTDQGLQTLYIINNHFTSMSGGELATEPRRTAQAAWNVNILEEILAEDRGAHVAILGDLNSYFDSPPINTLRQASLKHTFEAWGDDQVGPYTYIYQGESQVLDHILVTQSLMDLLLRVDVLHSNADYPPAEPGDPSPVRKSDHDPVIATFSLAK